MMRLKIERSYWNRGMERVAGVDEAGRGPLAGPVVAAAVIFPVEGRIEGVEDSKKLSQKTREELYDLIMTEAAGVGVGVVSHVDIDRLNILQASILAMQTALERLPMSPQIVLVDGNRFHHPTHRFELLIDGDARCFSIAAASIVAKVTRDRLMTDLDSRFPEYGFARNKGYATKEHLEAIKKFGFCEIHRRSFHPAILQPTLFDDTEAV